MNLFFYIGPFPLSGPPVEKYNVTRLFMNIVVSSQMLSSYFSVNMWHQERHITSIKSAIYPPCLHTTGY